MRYDWILFDADDTLFHFDTFSGLKLMFSNFDIDFTTHDFDNYQVVNKQVWQDYQNGTATTNEIKERRFAYWAKRLNTEAKILNNAFLESMAQVCTPISGVERLLTTLHNKVKMGIITNGLTDLQEIRLRKNSLRHFFDILVISEEVGVAKPNRKIFEYAHDLMQAPAHERVLMVGDNLDSDILGGINAGFHTCWFNQHNLTNQSSVKPHYTISSFHELEQIIVQ